MILFHRRLPGPPPEGFDCGRDEQTRFFYEHAWRDQLGFLSTTYVFFAGRALAAYATVFMDGLPLKRSERGEIRFSNVSALKLGQLGVSLDFQGQGIGTEVLGFLVFLAHDVGQRVACRYLTLDAQPDLVTWYAERGFMHNEARQEERVAMARRHG
ncbi:MAG TPA: GNAT family N-acetyltransferase, partial [Longimicrobium sp.]|nr:GNAT family N-acetyltransferase [Longimicrobium sp.]